ncbi:MAG: hypothetical protein IPF92_03135 [Myxococcales bacterium]|nr:hypothetical protein [Myxococcales bacterium]MBL0196740.1 hypothetical protein [Myxococcales bacterium]
MPCSALPAASPAALAARAPHAARSPVASIVAPVIAAALCLSSSGCKDHAKESEARAREHAQELATLVEKDVAEVERGLPEGAKRLATIFAKEEPNKNLPAVRAGLQKVRRDVPDLLLAKSTFFALADEAGIAIRNDLEQDAMAGQNLFGIFPGLAGGKSGYVSTTGAFPGPPGKAGPDKDWLAATPVKRTDGSTLGVFVTGWTFRRFALHLSETLKHDLQERLMASDQKGKMPVLYVGVFDKSGVYGAPQTPSTNEKALADIDLVGKTAAGPSSGSLVLTDRPFGWAAVRTPKLGADVGVFVLRSEI